MRQCSKCDRLFSSQTDKCLYCKSSNFKELAFESSTISSNYSIYSSEMIVDDQAYTIVKAIGKGGFGTVIKVLDSTDNQYYAMKVPLVFDEIFSNNKANLEEDIKYSEKYLENEIETILKYSDETFLYIYKKGTAHAFSKGKTIRFPVFIMELAECTLNDLIKFENEGNKIAFEERVKIIRETVNTISHLHSMNVLHRDLSPDNIFAIDRGGGISYVLGDFGISKYFY